MEASICRLECLTNIGHLSMCVSVRWCCACLTINWSYKLQGWHGNNDSVLHLSVYRHKAYKRENTCKM